MNDAFRLNANNSIADDIIKEKLADRLQGSPDALERFQIRRALRNPRALRRIRLELTEDLLDDTIRRAPE